MYDCDSPHLICIDIDGTLTIYPDILPQENILAIREARLRGHKVCINTGRAYANLPACILNADCFDGLICANGSYIRVGDNVLRNAVFPEQTVYDAVQFFLEQDNRFCLLEGETHLLKLREYSALYGSPGILLQSVQELQNTYKGVLFNVFSCEGRLPESFLRRFGDRMEIFQCDVFADCTVPGCSKASGMQFMAAHYDIPSCNTVAIGDSANDLPMMTQSGFSVAMANAAEDVRIKADYVTAANTEAGVAQAIRTLFLS